MKSFKLLFGLITIALLQAKSQDVEKIYNNQIFTIQLHEYGNQQGMPIYTIGSNNRIELNFDDMDADYKSYYYTYVLCDYNWKPIDLNPFEYIKGFIQSRITTYRYSSLSFTRYTHYQAIIPNDNSYPIKSGNYLLKVYLDGDTSKVVFTKKMLVLEPKTVINASVVQPFTASLFYTHQRVKFNVNIKDINSFSPAQQIKAVVLQNNRWDIAQKDIAPTFVRGNELEYNAENIGLFPGGKEWRWLDIRSFRMKSDRIISCLFDKNQRECYLKTDYNREPDPYVFYNDYNGMYQITTYESVNPFWQSDYAWIHFYFSNKGLDFSDKYIYLAGQFTNFQLDDKWKMSYNDQTKLYECQAYLKQGYYNYSYFTVDKKKRNQKNELEGNNFETENVYTILIYYKSFTDRNDRLIGVSTINSIRNKGGFSF